LFSPRNLKRVYSASGVDLSESDTFLAMTLGGVIPPTSEREKTKNSDVRAGKINAASKPGRTIETRLT